MSDDRRSEPEEAVDPELQELFDAARDGPTPHEVARMRENLAAAIDAELKKEARKRTTLGALLLAAALVGGICAIAVALHDPPPNRGAPLLKEPLGPDLTADGGASAPAEPGAPPSSAAPGKRMPPRRGRAGN